MSTRYKKSNCDTFVETIQNSVSRSKTMLQQKYEEVEFAGAVETDTFKGHYEALTTELDSFNKKVGSHCFLSS